MANKPKEQMTVGLMGQGQISLRFFHRQLGHLKGDFTLSVNFNDGNYRNLHGLGPDDVENMIRAHIDGQLSILYVWAVYR